MDIRPDELLSRVRIPRASNGLRHYYRKVGTRKAQAISKTCYAATARIENAVVADVRIAMGSVAPVPLRCVKTEAVVRGQRIDGGLIERAKAEFAGEITPIDDIRSTQIYRSRVSLNLLEDFLHGLMD
jgi:xanthine dehydrogenase iron-sulfur cluster and FAD-binding subunit A